nr:oxygen-independent coproporphyrinogen III oxidase [Eubacterium sp.]
MEQTGLYIHIPFCVRKCQYCDFLSFSANEEERKTYVMRLNEEIRRAADFFPEIRNVDSIFIGGGTPSILSEGQMNQLFEGLHHSFEIDSMAEISVECNPGTATLEKLKQYQKLGINRLSIGVQSLQNRELQKLGRIHKSQEAIQTYHMAREAGFENINLDLMSGIPEQSMASYEKTLFEICRLAPEHISAYSLIVEEGTPFYDQYAEKPPVSEDIDRQMYELTKEILAQYGYHRYEISNYAKSGFACKHNLKYWSGGDYLGLGLGAASKLGNVRYKNEADMTLYLQKIKQNNAIHEIEEVLTEEDRMAEFFILGLRKMQGVSRKEFEAQFAKTVEEQYGDTIRRMKEMNLLQDVDKNQIALTEAGIDVSNYVFQHFL